MNFDLNSTIVAKATAHGKGAIGVIRVSGSESWDIVLKNFSTKMNSEENNRFKPRYVYHGYFLNSSSIIDEVLLVPFLAPHSYTGENMAEIYSHGNDIIMNKIIAQLLKNGARLAKPGEFTMRAVLNGKMNLINSFALDPLIKSDNPYLVKKALNQLLDNSSFMLFNKIFERLKEIIAHLESIIEFPEEEIPDFSLEELNELIKIIEGYIRNAKTVLNYQDGVRIAIVGEPNAGKSTLFNTIVNSERVLVSSIPGTTRDVVSEYIELNGFKIKLFDTPGIRKPGDELEGASLKMSAKFIDNAHLILYLVDSTTGITPFVEDVINNYISRGKNIIKVINKIDLQNITLPSDFQDAIKISALTGENIDLLISKILSYIKNSFNEEVIILPNFVLKLLQEINNKLINGVRLIPNYDMVNQELKNALSELGYIIGEKYDPDILGTIFSNYCIGK